MSNSRWKLITLSDALAHPKFNGFGPEFCAMKNMVELFFENLDIKLDIVQDSNNVWNVLDKNEIKTEIFNFAKTQWLINDIKLHGCGFLPQAFTVYSQREDDFTINAHPGTFRYYAIVFNKMYDQNILIFDTHDFFNAPVLNDQEVKNVVSQGFIRERRVMVEEVVQDRVINENYIEHHEQSNQHDYIIMKTYYDLYKLYTAGVTLYVNHNIDTTVCKYFKDKFGFNVKKLPNLPNAQFYIPSFNEFKGVGIYLNYTTYDEIEQMFTLDLLYNLDFIDDVCYTEDRKILIFNCGSYGSNRLSDLLVKESKDEYLKKFLWAKKSKQICVSEYSNGI